MINTSHLPMRVLAGLSVLALIAAGCGSSFLSPAPGTSSSSGGNAPTPTVVNALPTAQDSALISSADDIPAGRAIPEGGGGPNSYTFREEWRRARTAAQAWRAGAHLVSATGQYVNDDGEPNSWFMVFIDPGNLDAALTIDIDPWGKVTDSEVVTGEGLISFINQYTKSIPYSIIDSDQAVQIGKADLATRYNLDKTKEPSLSLNFSRTDGSGPYWTYMLFYNSTAEYVSSRINALTGEVMPLANP
jgi:hypothetical protein